MRYLITLSVFALSCTHSNPPVDKPKEVTLSYAIPEPVVATTLPCPSGMVEVKGSYCHNLEMTCLKWLDPDNKGVNGPVQCAEFKYPTVCKGPETPKHFCIDKYEFPNKVGELPRTNMSWLEVKKSCESIGKRLCTESEWNLSCEGPERNPYPYGYHRDSTACNIDKKWVDPFEWKDPVTKKITKPTPFSILDQRVPSGSNPKCVSSYGVHDLTGNVDEYIVNESGRPYRSALTGGHFCQGARNLCRPKTLAHNENFTFYITSGRCCSDPK